MDLPIILDAKGVNEAFAQGLQAVLDDHTLEDSRNGPVMVARGPVITMTREPLQRVLFSPLRDANPFFHLFESLWMLAGRNDLPWLCQFNKRMASFSDDGGETQPAAYGHRWRKWFHYDQLEAIVAHLQEKPTSRRAVLSMWDAWPLAMDLNQVWKGGDLEKVGTSNDVPCNTNVFFQIRNGEYLDMSVQCRSNDVVWGAHGANSVHFSVLMEYMAARLDLIPGTMYQYSFNYHVYPGVLKHPIPDVIKNASYANAYGQHASTTPLFCSETVGGIWERELAWFMAAAAPGTDVNEAALHNSPMFTEPFFIGTAIPMLKAWRAHKAKDYTRALGELERMSPRSDWGIAAKTWISERMLKHEGKV